MEKLARDQSLKNFTENMVDARKRLGWTQDDLAKRLKERGLKFYAQTVQKIETGERRIQLAEAIEISGLLEMDLEMMLESPDANTVSRYQFEAEEAAIRVSSAVEDFIEKQLFLASVVDLVEAEGLRADLESAKSALEFSIEDRVEAGRDFFVSRHGADAADDKEAGSMFRQTWRSLGLPISDPDVKEQLQRAIADKLYDGDLSAMKRSQAEFRAQLDAMHEGIAAELSREDANNV